MSTLNNTKYSYTHHKSTLYPDLPYIQFPYNGFVHIYLPESLNFARLIQISFCLIRLHTSPHQVCGQPALQGWFVTHALMVLTGVLLSTLGVALAIGKAGTDPLIKGD